jgi:hypothetical protein
MFSFSRMAGYLSSAVVDNSDSVIKEEQNVQSVNDSRNITKNCQEDIDQQIGTAATLGVC